jgi:hypothetical protein
MFTHVPGEMLIKNKKYKVKTQFAEYTGIYGFTLGKHCFLDIKSTHYCGCASFLIDDNYYEFISQNPRWNMERRTVNLIVRRLLGDDHFEW